MSDAKRTPNVMQRMLVLHPEVWARMCRLWPEVASWERNVLLVKQISSAGPWQATLPPTPHGPQPRGKKGKPRHW